jgi:hypothetical protein
MKTAQICYSRPQISKLFHILKASVTYLYVMILPCILEMRQQHILSFAQNINTSTISHSEIIFKIQA